MTTRRQVLAALGAAAAGRREADRYTLGDVEVEAADQGVGWVSLDDPDVGSFGVDVTGAIAGAALDAEDTTDATAEVAYSDGAVYLFGEAAAALDGLDAHASASLSLSSDQARELAVALYRAAEDRDAALDASGDGGDRSASE